MYKKSILLIISVFAIIASHAISNEYESLLDYDWDQSRAPVVQIEQNLRNAETEADFRHISDRMIAVLESEEAGHAAKHFACIILKRIADDRSIPALAGLLTDEDLSHMARYALEDNPATEVDRALLAALAEVEGEVEMGILGTLSLRGNQYILPRLFELAQGDDLEKATEAIRAIGNAGDAETADALIKIEVTDELALLAADARLRIADRILLDGQDLAATEIYHELYRQTAHTPVRIAALGGLLQSLPGEQAAELVLQAIDSEDDDIRAAVGMHLLRPGTGPVVSTLAEGILAVPDEQKMLILGVIREGSHSYALESVLALLDSDNEEVQSAAIATLGSIGDGTIVPSLIELSAQPGDRGKSAMEALKSLSGPEVADSIIAAAETDDNAVRRAAIQVMAARAESDFAETMLEAARDHDPAIRVAAIRGLASVSDLEHIGAMVNLLVEAESSSERNSLLQAIVRTGLRNDDIEARAAPIVSAMPDAEPESKVSLMRALGRLGGEDSLQALVAELENDNREVLMGALNALADWNTACAAPYLLERIQDDPADDIRAFAMRGYINAAARMAAVSGSESIAMYQQALELAQNIQQRRAVLAGLARTSSLESFLMAIQMLEVEGLQAEAEIAAVQIGERIGQDAPEFVAEKLSAIAEQTENEALVERIENAIESMQENLGFVTAWLISGPYTGGNVHTTKYTPEIEGEEADWKLLEEGKHSQWVDLDAAVGGENRSAYAKTAVWSPIERDVTLSLGSDDGIVVWINGEEIFNLEVLRGLTIGENTVSASLKQGWNEVMLKISQAGAHWSFSIQFLDTENNPLGDLRVSPEKARQ